MPGGGFETPQQTRYRYAITQAPARCWPSSPARRRPRRSPSASRPSRPRLLAQLEPAATLPRRYYARVTSAGAPVAPTGPVADHRPDVPAADVRGAARPLARAARAGRRRRRAEHGHAAKSNPRTIEAFMAGLNHEFSSELLWREFPADLRHTAFRRFWDGGAGAAADAPVAGARSAATSPAATGRSCWSSAASCCAAIRTRSSPPSGRRRQHARHRAEAAAVPRSHRPGHHLPRLRHHTGRRAPLVLRDPGAAERAALRARRPRRVELVASWDDLSWGRHAHRAGPAAARRRTSSPTRARPSRRGRSTARTWPRSCASCRCASPSTPKGCCREVARTRSRRSSGRCPPAGCRSRCCRWESRRASSPAARPSSCSCASTRTRSTSTGTTRADRGRGGVGAALLGADLAGGARHGGAAAGVGRAGRALRRPSARRGSRGG